MFIYNPWNVIMIHEAERAVILEVEIEELLWKTEEEAVVIRELKDFIDFLEAEYLLILFFKIYVTLKSNRLWNTLRIS